MRISDWSSDVCSSDLDAIARLQARLRAAAVGGHAGNPYTGHLVWRQHHADDRAQQGFGPGMAVLPGVQLRAQMFPALEQQRRGDVVRGSLRLRERGLRRSEEHTSELQSLMRTSYAVFCLK